MEELVLEELVLEELVLEELVLEELVLDELVLDEVVVYPYAGGPVVSGLAKAMDAKVTIASLNDWNIAMVLRRGRTVQWFRKRMVVLQLILLVPGAPLYPSWVLQTLSRIRGRAMSLHKKSLMSPGSSDVSATGLRPSSCSYDVS